MERSTQTTSDGEWGTRRSTDDCSVDTTTAPLSWSAQDTTQYTIVYCIRGGGGGGLVGNLRYLPPPPSWQDSQLTARSTQETSVQCSLTVWNPELICEGKLFTLTAASIYTPYSHFNVCYKFSIACNSVLLYSDVLQAFLLFLPPYL